MLKKARLLTRPTLTRRDASWPRQGRSDCAHRATTASSWGSASKKGTSPLPVPFFSIPLYGFLDFATTQAASADPDAFCLAIDQRPDRLEVGFEDPFGLVIGVTDVMAGLATLATEIACECHGDTPSSTGIDTDCGRATLPQGYSS